MRYKRKLLFLLFAIIAITVIIVIGCSLRQIKGIENPQPSVYYWRTSYQLTDKELSFIEVHHIKKMYMRFFDVVTDGSTTMPNATLVFNGKAVKGVEIIPVVFITEDCLQHHVDDVAEKIVGRIVQMCQTNDISQPEEIQIDCDYTARSRKTYFDFLKLVRNEMDKVHIKRLSITIRLHQLSMPSPKDVVDYGVLMMYNTGDVRNYNCKNPILHQDDVKPYLRYLKSYNLPLCAAYPDFGWQLLFRGKKFKAILHGENLNDSTLYKRVAKDKYVLVSSRDIPSFVGAESYSENVNAGDSVFVKECTVNDILEVKRDVEAKRKEINQQVILYDLNEENINRFEINDYEKIFNR